MKKAITNFTKTCQECAGAKVLQHDSTSLSPVFSSHTQLFTHINVDLTGPINESCAYCYLMLIVDRFSRFIHASTFVGTSSEEFDSAFIDNWVASFHCAEKIFVTGKLNSLSLYGMKCVDFWVAK